jgi:hypothetical protein
MTKNILQRQIPQYQLPKMRLHANSEVLNRFNPKKGRPFHDAIKLQNAKPGLEFANRPAATNKKASDR